MLTSNEEKIVNDVERTFHVNFRSITAEQTNQLFNNPKFTGYFATEDHQKDFTTLLNGVCKIVEDKSVKDILESSRLLHQVILARSEIINYYNSFEDDVYTREELVNFMTSKIESDSEIAAFTAIIVNYDNCLGLKISSEKLVENLNKIRGKLEEIQTSILTYYQKSLVIDLICEVLDRYFRNEGVKICQDNPDIWNWVKDEIAKLQEVEDKDMKRPSEFDIEEDSQYPEEIGYLDITKLKKKEGTDNED